MENWRRVGWYVAYMVLILQLFPVLAIFCLSPLFFFCLVLFFIPLKEAGVCPVPSVDKRMHLSQNSLPFLFNEVWSFYRCFSYCITDVWFSRDIRKRHLWHWPDVASNSDIANIKHMLAGNFLLFVQPGSCWILDNPWGKWQVSLIS